MTEEHPIKFNIEIKNFSARNLTAMDSNGLSDPYFTISFPVLKSTPIYKSSVIYKTLNPVWEHDLFSYVYETTSDITNAKHSIQINVYDKNHLSSDFIGSVSVSLYSLFIGPVHNEFFIFDGTKNGGTIIFDFEAKQVCKPVFTLSNANLTGCRSSDTVPAYVCFSLSPFPDICSYTYFKYDGTPINQGDELVIPETGVDALVPAYAIFKIGLYNRSTDKRTPVTTLEYPLTSIIGLGRSPRVNIKQSNDKATLTGVLDVVDFPIAAQMTMGSRINSEYKNTVKCHKNFPHPAGHVEKGAKKSAVPPFPPQQQQQQPAQHLYPQMPPQCGFPQHNVCSGMFPQMTRSSSPPPQPQQQNYFPPQQPQQQNYFPPQQPQQAYSPPGPNYSPPGPMPQQPQQQNYFPPQQQQQQNYFPPQQQQNYFPPQQQQQQNYFPPQQQQQQNYFPPQQPQQQNYFPPQQQQNYFPPQQQQQQQQQFCYPTAPPPSGCSNQNERTRFNY